MAMREGGIIIAHEWRAPGLCFKEHHPECVNIGTTIDRTTLYRLMEKHGFRREEMAGAVDE